MPNGLGLATFSQNDTVFLTFFQNVFFFAVIPSCYTVLRGCVIYFMVKLNTPGCAAYPWPEKQGHMTLTYWPFKATKFDWNVQTLMFSEWNTRSVKPLMELMAASCFGAASPATLPKQKPWTWRCTGCIGNPQPPRIQHGKEGKPAPLIDLLLW